MIGAVDYKKIVQTLNYLAVKETGQIDKLKSLKLIWLIDRLHLRTYGRTVTGDNYFAMEHGPVPSKSKDFMEQSKFSDEVELSYSQKYIRPVNNKTFKSVNEVDFKEFSKSDIKVIDEIYAEFGSLTPFELVQLSHNYPEWKKYESQLSSGYFRSFKIEIADMFQNIENDNKIFTQSPELLKYSKEDFSLYSR